jgi:hypothetical protein
MILRQDRFTRVMDGCTLAYREPSTGAWCPQRDGQHVMVCGQNFFVLTSQNIC